MDLEALQRNLKGELRFDDLYEITNWEYLSRITGQYERATDLFRNLEAAFEHVTNRAAIDHGHTITKFNIRLAHDVHVLNVPTLGNVSKMVLEYKKKKFPRGIFICSRTKWSIKDLDGDEFDDITGSYNIAYCIGIEVLLSRSPEDYSLYDCFEFEIKFYVSGTVCEADRLKEIFAEDDKTKKRQRD